MATTIKITKETKERLESIDIAHKGKSFDMIVNDLVTYYEESKKKYEKEIKKYTKNREVWDNLLKWAKSKGFKG